MRIIAQIRARSIHSLGSTASRPRPWTQNLESRPIQCPGSRGHWIQCPGSRGFDSRPWIKSRGCGPRASNPRVSDGPWIKGFSSTHTYEQNKNIYVFAQTRAPITLHSKHQLVHTIDVNLRVLVVPLRLKRFDRPLAQPSNRLHGTEVTMQCD